MAELYEMSLWLHRFFTYFFGILTILFFIFTQIGEGVGFVKRIRFFLPLYNSVFAALIFTGLIILPILDFKLSFSIILMIISSIAIIPLIATSFKSLKRAYYTKNYQIYKDKMKITIPAILVLIILSAVL